jgi:hypothetical protein
MWVLDSLPFSPAQESTFKDLSFQQALQQERGFQRSKRELTKQLKAPKKEVEPSSEQCPCDFSLPLQQVPFSPVLPPGSNCAQVLEVSIQIATKWARLLQIKNIFGEFLMVFHERPCTFNKTAVTVLGQDTPLLAETNTFFTECLPFIHTYKRDTQVEYNHLTCSPANKPDKPSPALNPQTTLGLLFFFLACCCDLRRGLDTMDQTY